MHPCLRMQVLGVSISKSAPRRARTLLRSPVWPPWPSLTVSLVLGAVAASSGPSSVRSAPPMQAESAPMYQQVPYASNLQTDGAARTQHLSWGSDRGPAGQALWAAVS